VRIKSFKKDAEKKKVKKNTAWQLSKDKRRNSVAIANRMVSFLPPLV
jgi:hypothetical protein